MSVTLNNEGDGAYKPDVYGKEIIVERSISRDGVSNYMIKDENGKTISKLRSELDNIIEQFDIQVDNPCNILMQETSKQFLTSNAPGKKYELFLKATRLEQLKKNLEDSYETIEDMKQLIRSKEAALAPMFTKAEEYRQEYLEISRLEESKKKLRDYKDKLAWSYVTESEEKINSLTQKLETLEESHRKYSKEVIIDQEALEKAKNNLSEKSASVEEFALKTSSLMAKKTGISSRKDGCSQKIREYKRAIDTLKSEIKTLEKRCKEKEDNIKKRLEANDQRHDAERREKELECSRKEEELKLLQQKVEEISKEFDEEKYKSEIKDLRDQLHKEEKKSNGLEIGRAHV